VEGDVYNMAELKYSNVDNENGLVRVRTLDDIQMKMKEEIDKKFGYCRRLIKKAKWKGYFSSSRGNDQTFGRWNK
jgi:hypothetical protein